MNGILIVKKPKDMSSFRVVSKLRGITKEKKIGHTGTLDPMATGVLVALFGTATRACDIIPNSDKRYVAIFELGLLTDTLDITGNILEKREVKCSEEDIIAAVENFLGEIEQVPPMYSAIQVNGQRLYDLARQGKTVEREARKIVIKEIAIKDISENRVTIDVLCSKGTYIRTLCGDIGEKLGCGATLISLERTEACGFTIDEAVSLEEVSELCEKGEFEDKLIPVEKAFMSLKKLKLDEVQTRMYKNGVILDLNRIDEPFVYEDMRIYSFDDKFLGISRPRKEDESLEFVKQFPN